MTACLNFAASSGRFFRPAARVRGIDLAVRAGEIIGLLGPNGSGKTTTLRIAAGILPPDRGEVQIWGESLNAQARALRRHIGYMPERPPLYDSLTTAEYLDFVAAAKGLDGAARDRAIGDAVESFELGAVRRRVLGQLSQGFRQRVGLAQAVLGAPAVLLLDEATNGLDPLQIIEARDFIRRSAAGRAVVFSSHIMQEVAGLCTRVVVLHDGRLRTVRHRVRIMAKSCRSGSPSPTRTPRRRRCGWCPALRRCGSPVRCPAASLSWRRQPDPVSRPAPPWLKSPWHSAGCWP